MTTHAQKKMEEAFRNMNPDSREAAKRYLAENQVSQIFEVGMKVKKTYCISATFS